MPDDSLRHRTPSSSRSRMPQPPVRKKDSSQSQSTRPQHWSAQEDDSKSTISSSSNGSNKLRRQKRVHPDKDLNNIDEEQGGDGRYDMASLLEGIKGENNKQSNKSMLKYKSSLNVDDGADADETKNNSDSDVRSRTLLLKTAFWLTAWYGTSLATLFLNKIILSRNASVHVLGMCQMTTAAVLGGWSAFGGAEIISRCAMCIVSNLPEVVSRRIGLDRYQHERHHGKERHVQSEPSSKPEQGNNPNSPRKEMSFHFARDMSIVGVLRGLTVVLGLVALEHVPVSFVETIKATAPAFTVVFAWLILKEKTATPVVFTLIPVIAGLILCSASELSFNAIGFAAAVMNNCADCVQNVMSKRMLAHLRPTQLQFYASVAALLLQTPFVLRDATTFVRSWAARDTPDEGLSVESILSNEDDGGGFHSEFSLTKLLIIDAIFYHLQSVSAYCVMGCMSPVSQSVANTLKRALLVWASILYFGNPVTTSGVVGILMVVAGVFLYNHVRRKHST